MKRLFLLALLAVSLTALGGSVRVAAKSWQFNKLDGGIIEVNIDAKGTITVYDDDTFIGSRVGSCEPE